MKRDHAPSNCYAKGHSSEGDELLYKLLKSDARLVRSVLEVNGSYIYIYIYILI